MNWKEMDDGLEKLEAWTRENLPPAPTSRSTRTANRSRSLVLGQRRTAVVAGAAVILGVSTLFLLL